MHLSRPGRGCPGKLSGNLGNCRGLQIAQYGGARGECEGVWAIKPNI